MPAACHFEASSDAVDGGGNRNQIFQIFQILHARVAHIARRSNARFHASTAPRSTEYGPRDTLVTRAPESGVPDALREAARLRMYHSKGKQRQVGPVSTTSAKLHRSPHTTCALNRPLHPPAVLHTSLHHRRTLTYLLAPTVARTPTMTTPMCRICHSSTPPLITPCLCRGTHSHTHKSCLTSWITHRLHTNAPKQALTCELCLSTYAHELHAPPAWHFVCRLSAWRIWIRAMYGSCVGWRIVGELVSVGRGVRKGWRGVWFSLLLAVQYLVYLVREIRGVGGEFRKWRADVVRVVVKDRVDGSMAEIG